MPDESQAPPTAREKARLKKSAQKVLWVVIVIAVILAIWGIASRLIARSHLKKNTAADAQMTVVTVKPESSDADDELVLPGNVQAVIEASIYARTNGYLKRWYTDIGSRVHKGQPLADIETPEVDRQLGQALADLETARANASLAKSTNDRWKGLAIKQAVSRQDADEKSGDATAKAAAALSAEQNVARLKDLEAFKHVVAPFYGVVTARNTDVGSLINAGQATGTELFRLADIHKLRVYAQVPQAYAAAAKTGQIAELHFAEHPGSRTRRKPCARRTRSIPPRAPCRLNCSSITRMRNFFPALIRRYISNCRARTSRCACRPIPSCFALTGCRLRPLTVRTRSK